MANREREIQLKFRVTPEERELIEAKMAQLGTQNMAAYLRKMALDGYVVRLELPELREMVSLLRRSSNNLNQLSVLCYPSPGRWKKRSIRTRSQLQNGAVYGGLGAAPSTSNLGSSRQRKSQVWPRWVPRGIACRFLVPRIFALSGGISSNEKRGRLHILLLIIRIFQFDGSINDTFHNGQILLRAKL